MSNSRLARLEISKIYACCCGSMFRKTTSLTVLPVQPPKGGPPLEFINILPQNGGSAPRIHQHQPKNGGRPLGTISMDLAVCV